MPDKYARDEFERRFLVEGTMPPADSVEQIVDRYLDGTRLRLRESRTREGVVYKLGRIVDVAPGHKRLTNLYLTGQEAALLRRLPGKEVRKLRHVIKIDRQWVVDEFEDGTRIAEVEHAEGEAVQVPEWCGREVTDDQSLSGWNKAQPQKSDKPIG